jgi:hypothetical protein
MVAHFLQAAFFSACCSDRGATCIKTYVENAPFCYFRGGGQGGFLFINFERIIFRSSRSSGFPRSKLGGILNKKLINLSSRGQDLVCDKV